MLTQNKAYIGFIPVGFSFPTKSRACRNGLDIVI